MATNVREAFDNVSGKKTPWNPSRKAISRVTNFLPVPEACVNCDSKVEIVSNAAIYGREYGEWPWAFKCTCCDSYVGMHPYTNIPLGSLADVETRAARKRAKSVFNPLWQSGHMSRSEAYAWLAGKLGILDVNTCHVGWFDVDTCAQVVEICRAEVS